MAETNPAANETRRFYRLLLIIVVVGAAWRAWRLEVPALDNDEVWQVTHAELDLRRQVLRHDNFPPLYNWLVSFPIVLTGDFGARWFSWLVGVGTIPLVALLGRRIGGSTGGLVAAALLAGSANHVLLSQHGRVYAFLVLLATLLMLAAWRLRASDRWRDWLAFVATSWAMVASHYFGGVLPLLLGSLLLIEKRGRGFGRALAAAAALVLCCAPLLICLKADLAETGEFHHRVGFDAEAYAFGYLWLVTGGSLGPSVSQLREWVSLGDNALALRAMAPWALGAVAPVLVLLVAAWSRLKVIDRGWIAVLLLAPPLVVLAAMPMVSTGYNYRYIGWMLVPLLVICGAGAPAKRLGSAWAILLVLGVWATLNRQLDSGYAEHDFHAVTRLIAEADDQDVPPAVLAAPLHYGAGILYAQPDGWVQQLVTANPDADQDWDPALVGFAERVGSREHAWLVTQWFPAGHPQRPVCDALAARLGATLVERVSRTVMVYRFPTVNLRYSAVASSDTR